MKPAGLAEVDRAKADGRWARAYDSPTTRHRPGRPARRARPDPAAAKFFAELDGSNRYAILHRIQDAKQPETRARRIAEFVAMCSRGETVHPRRDAR